MSTPFQNPLTGKWYVSGEMTVDDGVAHMTFIEVPAPDRAVADAYARSVSRRTLIDQRAIAIANAELSPYVTLNHVRRAEAQLDSEGML